MCALFSHFDVIGQISSRNQQLLKCECVNEFKKSHFSSRILYKNQDTTFNDRVYSHFDIGLNFFSGLNYLRQSDSLVYLSDGTFEYLVADFSLTAEAKWKFETGPYRGYIIRFLGSDSLLVGNERIQFYSISSTLTRISHVPIPAYYGISRNKGFVFFAYDLSYCSRYECWIREK